MNSIPARREDSRLGSGRRANVFQNIRATASSSSGASPSITTTTTPTTATTSNDKPSTSSRAEVHVSVRWSGAPVSLFAVVYDERRRALRSKTRAEVGRTETIQTGVSGTSGGNGSRTFLRSFIVRTGTRTTNLRVALFEFVKNMNSSDHIFVGAVTFTLNDVLEQGLHTRALFDSEAGTGQNNRNNGIDITLRAQQVDNELFSARRSIAVRMVVPEMRRRKFPHQLITQSFDISRQCSSSDGSGSWVPIYRSEALAAPSASSPHERHVRFDASIIPEWRLYGIETPLRIRYNQHSVRYKSVHVAAVCYTSLAELQILDPSRDYLPLYGGKDDTACVGRLFLTQAEPTKSGGVFSLTVQYHYQQFSLSNTTKRALSKTAASFRRNPDDWSFGGIGNSSFGGAGSGNDNGDSSFGTTPSFGFKFRKKVLSDKGPPQRTAASARDFGAHQNRCNNNNNNNGAYVPRRTLRWRTWLNT